MHGTGESHPYVQFSQTMCDKNILTAAENAGVTATLMPILISKYWSKSCISYVVHETGRGIEMRKIQQLVHIKKVLGKTSDRFYTFNVLHSSTAFGEFAVLSIIWKIFSEELRFTSAITAGKKIQSLHYFMYLSTL